jgi:hypothetical protein
MSRRAFKIWIVCFLGIPVCLFILSIILSLITAVPYEMEMRRANAWVQHQTADVVTKDHRWDSVKLHAYSKDGIYIVIDGVVGTKSALQDLQLKMKSSPAPVYINWSVQVQTNSFILTN